MLFTEEDSPALKTWIVNRLADTSDADADVLADYVLALLRQDADLETVRQLCLAEIPDFLKKDSAAFVEDVFDAIRYKSYLPGAAPPPPRRHLSSQPPADPSTPSYGGLGIGGPLGNLNGGRKRSYNDRGEGDFQNGGYQQGGDPNGRQFKQPRRGGPGMGRGNFDNPNLAGRGGYDGGRGGYDGRGGFDGGRGGYGGNRPPPMNHQGMPGPGFQNMTALPNPPPGMPPFDPHNPIASILAMQQVMGLPIPPGMPQFPLAASPGPVPGLGFRGPSGLPTQRRKVRCRDYDEAGFCSRGNTCMFEHGEHAVWTPPPKNDEYNPNTSLMAGIEGNTPAEIPHVNLRGNFRGRAGRGGAGGRGDFTNTRKNGRSEFSSDRPNFDKSNTSIVIENIPEEKFTEDEVRSFFAEFGTILEVEMRAYKRLAIIKFEAWDSAQAAYKSPKVIFDNRFVKVYWYTSSESLPQPPSGTKSNDGASFSASAHAKAEPEIDIEEFTRKQQQLQKLHEEKMRKKQEVDTARQALEKRQQELLRSQAEMLEKIAAKSGKPLAPLNGIKQETSEPSQTDQLKAQLAALEEEAQSLGIDTTALPDQALSSFPPRGGYRGRASGGYRGRGAFVPRGRGGYEPRGRGGYRGRGAPFAGAVGGGVMRLDNRPKTVSMTGVDFTDSEKDESLRQYLLGVGEYISIDVTPTITSITFKERFVAEKFMFSTPGCVIPSVGRVEMAWVKNSPPLAATSSSTNSSSPVKSEPINVSHKDINMLDEGDAMSGSRNVNGNGGSIERETNQNQNLDYDVADDEFF